MACREKTGCVSPRSTGCCQGVPRSEGSNSKLHGQKFQFCFGPLCYLRQSNGNMLKAFFFK